MNHWWKLGKAFVSFLIAAVLISNLVACGNRASTSSVSDAFQSSSQGPSGQISEVSPPEAIQQLRTALDVYQPQVAILSPTADEILKDTNVEVTLQVQDLPIFQDPQLGLGPHLHVILDNQPYEAVYDLNKPLVLKDLSPGTHTLRAFASRPWHESFKNEGAYAQTTFHVFTKTAENNPDPAKPLLTYSRPKGSYGAEPILLDFYLTNAPLHLVAQEKTDDEIADWRVRVTVNGESFVQDKWQPIYLKGFKPGKNWVQLEFLDEKGNLVNNVFNNTVRLITYEPKGKDTLSKLVRGELKAADARGIIGTAGAGLKTTPPSEIPTPTPSPEETPVPQLSPEEPSTPELEPTKPAEPIVPEVKESEKPQGGFFNRFRRPPVVAPTPVPTVPPEVLETPAPKPLAPEPIIPQPETTVVPSPEVTPPLPEPKQLEKPQGGFFNRFRRPPVLAPTPAPSVEPTLPEVIEAPTAEPDVPSAEVTPAKPLPLEKPQRNRVFKPTKLPTEPEVKPTPTFPEIIVTPTPGPLPPTVKVAPKPLTPTPVEEKPAEKLESTTEPIESSAEEKPKVDLKQLLIPQPTSSPGLKIIQVPADTDIPSSFLKKSTPEPDVSEPSEIPPS